MTVLSMRAKMDGSALRRISDDELREQQQERQRAVEFETWRRTEFRKDLRMTILFFALALFLACLHGC